MDIDNTRKYETKDYQRRAYKNYYDRKKTNEDFKEKRRIAQKKYYEANKVKVLQKMKDKRISKKETTSEEDSE
jgi:hypothetical protein